jgi:diadenylate cyclase
MLELFIQVRLLDLLDILLVAIIFYEIYQLVKGTVALNIFMGIFIVFGIYLVVKSLKMELLGSLLGQLFGIGAIAIIIVFQQEVRRFLLMLGSRYRSNRRISLENLFSNQYKFASKESLEAISEACSQMAANRTGALIVLARESELQEYVETGEKIDSLITADLIKSIFFKNSPLHDGALIIRLNRAMAARCILPLSQRLEINPILGLRHRAAIGITEQTDAFVVVISEESGSISVSNNGELIDNVQTDQLLNILESGYK